MSSAFSIVFFLVIGIIMILVLLGILLILGLSKRNSNQSIPNQRYYYPGLMPQHQSQNLIICKSCGNETSDQNQFCPKCGAKIVPDLAQKRTKKCVHCNKEFPSDRYYCDTCGSKLE